MNSFRRNLALRNFRWVNLLSWVNHIWAKLGEGFARGWLRGLKKTMVSCLVDIKKIFWKHLSDCLWITQTWCWLIYVQILTYCIYLSCFFFKLKNFNLVLCSDVFFVRYFPEYSRISYLDSHLLVNLDSRDSLLRIDLNFDGYQKFFRVLCLIVLNWVSLTSLFRVFFLENTWNFLFSSLPEACPWILQSFELSFFLWFSRFKGIYVETWNAEHDEFISLYFNVLFSLANISIFFFIIATTDKSWMKQLETKKLRAVI